MNRHESMAELVDLYALDALEGSALRRFEAHLDQCSICRSEFDTASTVLASLVPDSDPPQHVWLQIVDELDRDDRVESIEDHRRRSRSGSWIGLISLAAGVAILFAGLLFSFEGDTDPIVAAAEAASDVQGSIDVGLAENGVLVARVVIAEDGRGFVLPTESLVDLSSDRTYQLWVVNDDARVISAGVLGSSPGPSTFTWAGGVSGVALTREVVGGVEVSDGDVVAAVTDI